MHVKRLTRTLAATAGVGVATISAAALLGLTTSDPTIDTAPGGVIAYRASDGTVTIQASPQVLMQTDPFLFGEVIGATADDEKLLTIQFKVDGAGNFLRGTDGAADLIVKGAIDTNFDGIVDYDGILLEAEVTQFGSQDGAGGATDRFDIRLTNVTGLLAPLYAGRDLSIVVDSEPSVDYTSPFGGSFAANFSGPAKVVLGTTAPLNPPSCKVDVESYCSVDGSPNRSVCRIKVTKSPWHWEHVSNTHGDRTFKMYKYGMHGDPVPPWASRFPATPVRFTYVVKNTGTTPITGLKITDAFDADPSGYATTLAPGQKVTVVRTEALREGLVNTVVVSGQTGGATCMDKDVVAVKDKVRSKRQNDSDRYKDRDKEDDHKGHHR